MSATCSRIDPEPPFPQSVLRWQTSASSALLWRAASCLCGCQLSWSKCFRWMQACDFIRWSRPQDHRTLTNALHLAVHLSRPSHRWPLPHALNSKLLVAPWSRVSNTELPILLCPHNYQLSTCRDHRRGSLRPMHFTHYI